MEVPAYLKVLWGSKWMLLVGAVIAAVAAFFAGFSVQNGEIVPRAEQTYRASTTVLLSSESSPLYQAILPGEQVVEGQTAPEATDLTSRAIVYAYLISGQELRAEVQAQLGEFTDADALTALRRTTQPAGDEAFSGRYVLPIVGVTGTSNDPDRAEAISRTATAVFQAQVLAEQNIAQLPEQNRVTLNVIDEGPAQAVEGSNPAIPVVVTFLGIFLLFVAAAYIIAGAKASRERKRAAAAPVVTSAVADADADATTTVSTAPAPKQASPRAPRKSTPRAARTQDVDTDEEAFSMTRKPRRGQVVESIDSDQTVPDDTTVAEPARSR